MLIKLNLEGELLENLLKDAARNCRTNPKQIEYYLKEIYSGNIIVLNDNQQGTNKVLTECLNALVSTNKINNSTNKNYDSTVNGNNNTNQDQLSNNIEQKNKEQLQKEVNQLDDDIINF